MGFGSRQPNSNDLPRYEGNPWGPQDGISDDFSILVGGHGKRCNDCKRVVLNRYLKEKNGLNYCPDCYQKSC